MVQQHMCHDLEQTVHRSRMKNCTPQEWYINFNSNNFGTIWGKLSDNFWTILLFGGNFGITLSQYWDNFETKMKKRTSQEWYNNFKEVNPTGEVSRETYRKLYSETLFGEIG